MRRDIIINNNASEILRRIGGYGLCSIGQDQDGDDIIVSCTKYTFDRLTIYATNNNLCIYYAGQKVFSSADNIYIPGSWERLFNELYYSLDVLENEKRQEEQKTESGRNFYENNLRKYEYCDYKVREMMKQQLALHGITVSIKREDLSFYEQHDYSDTYEVYKDDNRVFRASRLNYSPLSISTFTPGPWIQEFTTTINDVQNKIQEQKAYEQENELQNSILKLRKKRK